MKRMLRGVLMCGAAIGLLVGVVPSPLPVVVAAAPTYDQSVGILQVYFQRLNTRQYSQAYSIYAAPLQRRQSYSAFVANFGLVSRFDLTVLGTAPAGELTIVRVTLVARLTNGGLVNYAGSYTIGRENGRYRIVGKNILSTGNDALARSLPPSSLPLPP